MLINYEYSYLKRGHFSAFLFNYACILHGIKKHHSGCLEKKRGKNVTALSKDDKQYCGNIFFLDQRKQTDQEQEEERDSSLKGSFLLLLIN